MQKIDIYLISETHLTKESFIKFRGYTFYHNIHPTNTARGGSVIIIKKNISHHQEPGLSTAENQVIAVTIKSRRYKVTIAAIYCPPRYNQKKENYLNVLSNLGEKFIIGGYFNAKNARWESRMTTAKGNELHKSAAELRCSYMSTGKPTYWPNDQEKTPDLFEAEKFIVDIQQAAWNNTPEIKSTTKGINYPNEVKEMLAEKRKLRKKWQQSRTPENKNSLNNITQRLKI
ncbi:hypothetical protein GWI33_008237 [Rhynchophorus ferrugineus]|uniref:Endonuclease/exonuclease/phosphatase domain-containing protein n=1 Tax=Rhynchophorus ferrugineus TaxID=354439 RepID=A0A834MCC5_RHYFE|nr:hypothetical protein GWI33_008237 [Rhynchophorus ferrugineus]